METRHETVARAQVYLHGGTRKNKNKGTKQGNKRSSLLVLHKIILHTYFDFLKKDWRKQFIGFLYQEAVPGMRKHTSREKRKALRPETFFFFLPLFFVL